MKNFILSIVATIALTSALVGCANKPVAPEGSSSSPTKTQKSSSTSAATKNTKPTSADQSGYRIGPGDKLDIFVWGYKDLSVLVPVRPDGKITTRLIEDLQASGRTPSELARDIETKYQTFVKNPTVTITVEEFVGVSSQQVKVVGGGAKPQTIPYRNSMTVLDVMIDIEGLTEFSAGNRAKLVRTVDGKRQTFKLRLKDLLEGGDISADRPVQPGDVIIIPESWF